MKVLEYIELSGVSGGARCACYSGGGVNQNGCIGMEHINVWNMAIGRTEHFGIYTNEPWSVSTHWRGDVTKDECIAKCCNEVGSSWWVWGASQAGKC